MEKLKSAEIDPRWELCKKRFEDIHQRHKLRKMSRPKTYLLDPEKIVSDLAENLPRRPNGRVRTFLEGPGQNLERKFRTDFWLTWWSSFFFPLVKGLQWIHCSEFIAVNSLQWILCSELIAVNSWQLFDWLHVLDLLDVLHLFHLLNVLDLLDVLDVLHLLYSLDELDLLDWWDHTQQ